MKIIATTILIFGFLALRAQTFHADASTTGVLKTTEGKYTGTIDVSMENDQVMWRADNVTKIFSARQIKEAEVRLPGGETNVYKGFELNGEYYLFLVISAGKAEILFKRGVIRDQFTKAYYPDYFVIGKKKSLVPLEKKKDFIDAFGDDAKWMAQYIKNQNLDLERVKDISQAFDYYNNSFEATHPSP